MNIIQRAVRIITTPDTEWPIIGAEPSGTGQLLTYAAVLSALAQVAAAVGQYLSGNLLSGMGADTATPMFDDRTTVVVSIVGWAVGLVLLVIMGLIASVLAGSFGGRGDRVQGLKLATYSSTPVWLFGLVAVIPILGWLAIIAGYIYSIVLIYRGVPHTVGIPAEKRVSYTAILAILWLILGLVLGGLVIGFVVASMMMGAGGARF